MTETCSVCCENYNKSKHKKFSCPSCEFDCCRQCIRKYLLESKEEPHCMKCKNRWSRDITIQATLKSFVNGEYKEHTKKVLMETEKSKLSETMSDVENHLKCRELRKKIDENKDEIKRKKEELEALKHINLRHERHLYLRRTGQHKACRKEFIKKCSVEGCRGFLSTQWKCGICNKYTCPKCFAVKESGEETKNPEHVCKEEDLKTAELIRKECKDCPGCGTSIFKTEGCDQMWCTQCHQTFSWRTGMKVTGVIHNPHFIAWQNSGQAGHPINLPGTVMCGGMPSSYNFKQVLYNAFNIPQNVNLFRKPFEQKTNNEITTLDFIKLHREILHFSNVELNYIRGEANDNQDNKDLRIKYILKQIDEEEMEKELIKRKKKYEKNRSILDIYEFINTTFTESIRDIYESLPSLETKKQINKCLDENYIRLHKIRRYANEELRKISLTYSQSVNIITLMFIMTSVKFTKNIPSDIY